MKLALDYRIRVGDDSVDSKQLSDKLEAFRGELAKEATLEGAIVVVLDGQAHSEDQPDPIFRLGGQWVRKLPWVLAGDTETVALRNSERCFGFTPAGDGVEISFFVGSEGGVEEYLFEPTTVRLETFATESLRMAERLLDLARKLNPTAVESNEDVRDLRDSYEEGKKAWRDYQLHNRR